MIEPVSSRFIKYNNCILQKSWEKDNHYISSHGCWKTIRTSSSFKIFEGLMVLGQFQDMNTHGTWALERGINLVEWLWFSRFTECSEIMIGLLYTNVEASEMLPISVLSVISDILKNVVQMIIYNNKPCHKCLIQLNPPLVKPYRSLADCVWTNILSFLNLQKGNLI